MLYVTTTLFSAVNTSSPPFLDYFQECANFESYYRAEKQNGWHISTPHAVYQLVHSCLSHLYHFMLGLCTGERNPLG